MRRLHILFLVICIVSTVYAGDSLPVTGDIQDIHDPCIIKSKGMYYVFSTGKGLKIHQSKDLIHWESSGYVFDTIPEWAKAVYPPIIDLWAPDISYFNGKYYLYCAASKFGTNRSAIGLATNKTLNPKSPDYHWVDEGSVIQSYPKFDDWNTIDPNLVMDEKNQPWLNFGSYWSGIKMRKIDKKTGKLSSQDTTLYSLARRIGDTAIEAPFIIRHKSYYYLFVSFDHCCQGKESNYNVRVGRSKNLLGPYLDKEGKPLMESGGTQIVKGNDRWVGPGHCAILQDKKQDYIVYHSYDAEEKYIPKLRITSIHWDKENWPIVNGP